MLLFVALLPSFLLLMYKSIDTTYEYLVILINSADGDIWDMIFSMFLLL